MSYRNFDCDKCRMPSPSVEILIGIQKEIIDVQEEIKTEQEMMLTTYLLMARSIETLQGRNNRLENENEKLRELSKYAILCSEGDARCLGCPYHDKEAESYSICAMRKAAIELGVEVSK